MKIIAAFDFDGTITKKDSFLYFILYSKGYFFFIVHLPQFILLRVLSLCRILSVHYAKEKIISICYKGVSVEQFDSWCINYLKEIDYLVRPNALKEIRKHQKNNLELIIVSASIENWIIPWANKVGIKTVIGTKLEVNSEGKLTGRFASPNCIGKEKVRRLLEIYPNKSYYYLISYGDSNGDKDLLAFSDKSYFCHFH